MTYSFNLIDQPWIPCARPDGQVQELSLRETLARAHELRGAQGDSPLETASLYRLLLAVIHSVLRGPKSVREWESLWQAGQFPLSRFEDYLQTWYSRFDLFDEARPFYQFKGDDMVTKSALLLPHGMSTANELFEHQMVVETTPIGFAQAARMLLVGQYFGLGGLVSPGKPNLTRAPLINGISFVVEGDTLFQTLLLNCLQYSKDTPLPTVGTDEPTWEMKKPFKPRKQPNGYLDYLTWQNRIILLVPDENARVKAMQIMRGLDLGKELEDPFKLYTRKDDKGWRFLPFTEARSLWRDSHTLLRRHNPDDVHPPKTVHWLARLLEETDCLKPNQKYRYMALGAGVHNKKAKIYFYRHESMPLPLTYLANDELVSKLTDAVTRAEQVKSALNRAVFTLAKNFISPSAEEKGGRQPDSGDVDKLMKHWSAEAHYWSQLEANFNLLIMDLPADPEPAMARWNETLRQTAREALTAAERMAGENTKALKAAVKARGALEYELKKVFAETQPTQEVKA
jgi:CRISPR system Cascade subunit CasA